MSLAPGVYQNCAAIYAACRRDEKAAEIRQRIADLQRLEVELRELHALGLTTKAIEKVTPAGAVVSIVTPQLDTIADIRQLICSGQLFFKSAEAAKE